MSIPKTKQADKPAPAPDAPPSPEASAVGFNSAGRSSTTSSAASSLTVARRGVDNLRVDLNVPNNRRGSGLTVP